MHTIRRLAFAPLMRVWLVSQRFSNQSSPRPTDAPFARAGASVGHRVLIFGSGPAVGWGGVSHEIALPGSLARALSTRTGRGTEVDVVADMRINAGNAVSALRHVECAPYEAIVLILGPNDALPLTALPKWRSRLAGVLTYLHEQAAPQARIVVTGVPPIRSVPGFGNALGSIAHTHATQMNLVTEDLSSASPRTTFVPLSAARDLPTGVRGDGRTYRLWANEIADALAPQLEAPGQDLHGGPARDIGSD